MILPAFEDLCRRWSAAAPSCCQAWNMLGKFYKAKGEKRKAIEAYRKSLEIEWNQPDILTELNKMEQEKL